MEQINQSNKKQPEFKSPLGDPLECLEMPEYQMQADKEEPDWLSHLNDNGVVIVKNVLKPDEVNTGIDKYWEYLQHNHDFQKKLKPKRFEDKDFVAKDQRTLHSVNWPVTQQGFSAKNYSNHSDAAWYLRTIPNVKRCFEQIWKTDGLLCSFDILIAWRQWWLNPDQSDGWLPKTEGLHIDQNPVTKKGRHCVQGMLVLKDVDENVGGLEVVPGSSSDDFQKYLQETYAQRFSGGGDWCVLNSDQNIRGKGKLVKAKAGDLILWDSRTVHGGIVGPGYTQDQNPLGIDQFSRLAFTVCMTPKNLANNYVIEQRQKAYTQGIGTTHWPHEFISVFWGGYTDKIDMNEEDKFYKPVALTKSIQDLVG